MRKQSTVNACCQLSSLCLIIGRFLCSWKASTDNSLVSLGNMTYDACKVRPQVLDDNCTLCLPNGERLKLNPVTMRMLFEVADLSVASPATVSRCGMVYVPPDHLGWRYLLAAHAYAIMPSQRGPPPVHHGMLVDAQLVSTLSSYGCSKHLCDKKRGPYVKDLLA